MKRNRHDLRHAEVAWMRKVFATAAANAENKEPECDSSAGEPSSNDCSTSENPSSLPMLHPATRSQSRDQSRVAPASSSTGCGKLPSIWMRATTILDAPDGRSRKSASQQHKEHLRSTKSCPSGAAPAGSGVGARAHGRGAGHGGMSLPLKSELDQYVARHGNPFGFKNHLELLASDPTDRPTAWRPTDIQMDLNDRRRQKRVLDAQIQQYLDRCQRNTLPT